MQRLLILAILQGVLYGALAWLSRGFAYGTVEQERPLLTLLTILCGCFALYVLSIRAALRSRETSTLLGLIIGAALLYRGILLPTDMIQELDLYRYLWDGAAVAEGVNPYCYSPQQVRDAMPSAENPVDLQKLVELRESSPHLAEVLKRVHFEELPTCYPPVSQAVFALGDWLTPDSATVERRVTLLKCLIVAFDLATIGLLWLILRSVGRHSGWLVAYSWCPLLLKEFANSGHLDSIAVCFSVATVWCVVRLMVQGDLERGRKLLVGAVLASALAVGAKLYPVVLLPVLAAAIATKHSLRTAAVYLVATLLLSALLLAPMLLTAPATVSDLTSSEEASQQSGLSAFLTQWEMNDFLFMLVFENLRPDTENSQRPAIWFAVVPNGWREACVEPLAQMLNVDSKTAAFLLTRGLTSCLFFALAMVIARNVYRHGRVELLLEGVFLTLAWFWLLSPTQNPWYWTWALPFLPFARNRAWWAVSGLALFYYFRFFMRYHFGDQLIPPTNYNGTQFFDFVLTWLEFAPWLLWLAASAHRRR